MTSDNREVMREVDRRMKALRIAESTLSGWIDEVKNHGQGEDIREPLSVDTHRVTVITVAYGGPTAYFEFDHSTGRAAYVTNEPDYANRETGPMERVELTGDESDELAEVFGLETD